MKRGIFEQPDVVLCRPALPMDTPDVIELTRHIWEGEDYVPRVWNEWLADPYGILAVAEVNGKVVGLGKLTRLSEYEWWLEGLRVHPDFEGRGIASRVNRYQLEYWNRFGAGVVRLATGSHREPVKHLAKRSGFKRVAEYTIYKTRNVPSDSISSRKFPFTQLNAEDVDSAAQYLSSSSEEILPYGLVNLGWQFGTPISSHIKKLLREGKSWWWRKRSGLLFLEEKEQDSENIARILTLACKINDLEHCLNDIKRLVRQLGCDQVSWLAPLLPNIGSILLQSGYERDWDSSLLIFEKVHHTK